MRTLNCGEDWRFLRQFLPGDLDRLAKETGAVKRWRNIRNGEELLRLILAYVVEDLSLRSTAAWSTCTQGEMKDTSVLHRLRQSVPFMEAVLGHLMSLRLGGESASGPPLRLNDATVLSIPGSTGTDWRIHAVYNPQSRRLARVQVTDAAGGERLDRDRCVAGEVIIADRGLAHAKGIQAVTAAGAYSLLRMHWQNIRLLDRAGQGLKVNEVLQRAEAGYRGTDVLVPVENKTPVAARLLVRPLPPDSVEKARRNLRRNAAKKKRQPSDLALRLAGYFCVLTTLPKEVASDEVVLELYRIRWQIELFFKRCKSLLSLHKLRADDPKLARAHCMGKLIAIVLVELLATEGDFFSPWGVPRQRRAACEPLASSASPPD